MVIDSNYYKLCKNQNSIERLLIFGATEVVLHVEAQSGTFKNEFIKLGIPAEDYEKAMKRIKLERQQLTQF